MNDSKEVATQQREHMPMTSVGMSGGDSGTRISPQNLGEVVKFAEVMSRAGKMIPGHLKDDVGACMAVALQAFEWQMNPFSVASKSYFVNQRIAYEAQLIAAVVNTRSGIKGRLRYEYIGEGAEMICRVSGELDGTICEYETPPIGSITVKNSPLWKSDPRQQLGYFGARSWARRHCPEVILGVYDRDETAEMKDVTPAQGSGLAERLSGPVGGFDADGINKAIGEATESDMPEDEPDMPKTEETAPAPSPEPENGKTDDEIKDHAAKSARAGKERTAPDVLNEDQSALWGEAYDAEFEKMEEESGVSA